MPDQRIGCIGELEVSPGASAKPLLTVAMEALQANGCTIAIGPMDGSTWRNYRLVTYSDGTEATVEQQARDVVTFMAWAAEPNMEARKETGIKVLLFLIVLTAFLYALKRKIWSDVH